MNEIIEIMLKNLRKRLDAKSITLDVTEEAKSFIIQKGYDKAYGARPLKRVIQNHIEDGLAERMLQGEIRDGNHVVVDVGEDGELAFAKECVMEKV